MYNQLLRFSKGLRITDHFSNFVFENVIPAGSSQFPLKYWQDTKGCRTSLITSMDQRDLWESKAKPKWEGKFCPCVTIIWLTGGGNTNRWQRTVATVWKSPGRICWLQKTEGFWWQAQLLKWNWVFFTALQFNWIFCRWWVTFAMSYNKCHLMKHHARIGSFSFPTIL